MRGRCSVIKDVENELFTAIATVLRNQFPKIYVTSEAVSIPPKFPCVCFYEADNYMSTADLDSSGTEKIATLLYRIDVYSNKANGRKSEAKEILSAIAPELYLRNFTRFSRVQINDMGDKIIHITEQHRVKYDGEAFYRI